MTPDDPRHGTNGGYLQHVFAKESACQPCREAHNEARRNLWRKRYARGVDRLYIDSTGTIRRIRALMAIGWRYCDIDQAAGYDATRATWAHNLTTQKRVHIDTAEKVARIYDDMCMTPGPSQRLKNLAVKRGWAPPLAWDDDTIDDPDELPDLGGVDDQPDPVVVDRLLARDVSLARTATAAERRAVVAAWPWSLAELERLTGWRADRYIVREEGAA